MSAAILFAAGRYDAVNFVSTGGTDETWSQGPLTLTHMLARLVLAEQLYRAAALLANHPYHRA